MSGQLGENKLFSDEARAEMGIKTVAEAVADCSRVFATTARTGF